MSTDHARTHAVRSPLLVLATLVTALLALGAILATAGAEATIFRPDLVKAEQTKRLRGVFKVKVEGVQTNTWSENRSPQYTCDVTSSGSGSERIRFRTPFRRMTIAAYGEGRPDSAIFAPLTARGTVTRSGRRTQSGAELLPANCVAVGNGTGETVLPPASDCGTRPIKGIRLSLFARDGELTLDRARGTAPEPFSNCTWTGLVWPSLLTSTTADKPISTDFDPRWIFNRKFNRRTGEWSKVIMIARGSRVGRSIGSHYKTSIRWTVTMQRLR